MHYYFSYKLGCKTIAILIATGEAVFSFLRNSVIVAAFGAMTFKLKDSDISIPDLAMTIRKEHFYYIMLFITILLFIVNMLIYFQNLVGKIEMIAKENSEFKEFSWFNILAVLISIIVLDIILIFSILPLIYSVVK